MNIRHFSCILLLMTALQPLAWAQPKAEFETQEFDFGVAYPNNHLVHQFVIKNIGTEPLEITDVRTTCGCTAAVVENDSIAAGATGAISVTMSTAVPGIMHKTATVFTNDPQKKQNVLDIRANVRDIWQWTPKSSYQFRDVPFKSSAEAVLTLTNIESEPFNIVGYKVSRPEFVVEHSKIDDDKAKVKVKFQSGTVKETVTDQLEIRTDNPHQPIIRVTMYAQVVGNIKYSRQRIYFGSIKAGETVSHEIIAHYNSDEVDEFKINKITSNDGMVTGEVVGKTDDGGLRMKFVYTAPNKTGYHKGELSIETNVESEKISILNYSALVRK